MPVDENKSQEIEPRPPMQLPAFELL